MIRVQVLFMSKECISKVCISLLCMSVAAGMVAGCATRETSSTSPNPQSEPQEANTQEANTQEANTQETASEPASQTSATSDANASSPLMAGTAQNTGFTGQDLACDASEHFTEIIWQEGQPRMTFAKKPDETTLNEAYPVTIATNADGSRTYGYKTDITVYSRFYLDGSCLIQTLDSQGNSTLEAPGQTAQIGAIRGVDIPLEPEASAIAIDPELIPLALVCSGTIQDEVDFTIYFERQTGFSRAELRPHTSDSALTATLTRRTKNALGQDIWQGSVSETTDVTVVHLSRSIPKAGDELSVGYGGSWGRAICEDG